MSLTWHFMISHDVVNQGDNKILFTKTIAYLSLSEITLTTLFDNNCRWDKIVLDLNSFINKLRVLSSFFMYLLTLSKETL